LREEVLEANLELVRRGLVLYTFFMKLVSVSPMPFTGWQHSFFYLISEKHREWAGDSADRAAILVGPGLAYGRSLPTELDGAIAEALQVRSRDPGGVRDICARPAPLKG
jgi:hypothetical protein